MDLNTRPPKYIERMGQVNSIISNTLLEFDWTRWKISKNTSTFNNIGRLASHPQLHHSGSFQGIRAGDVTAAAWQPNLLLVWFPVLQNQYYKILNKINHIQVLWVVSIYFKRFHHIFSDYNTIKLQTNTNSISKGKGKKALRIWNLLILEEIPEKKIIPTGK